MLLRPFTVLPDTVALAVPLASQIPESFSRVPVLKLPTVFWLTVAPLTPCMYKPTPRMALAPLVLSVFCV